MPRPVVPILCAAWASRAMSSVAVQRQDQGGVVGQHQQVGRDHALGATRSISASRAQGSTTTPLPITDSLPCTTPEGSSDSL